MHRSTRRSSRLAASAAALMALTLGAAACGSGGSSDDDSKAVSSSKPCGTDEDTTVTVGLFGTFGFKENGLYDEYMKKCPNVTIKEDVVTQSADYWTRLKTRLAPGSGLVDVQAGTLYGTIPVLIAFAFLGKHIVGGVMQGAVKG